MALVKGICKNYGECSLADGKEIQEADKTNFVCEECGKPLYELTPSKKSKSSKVPVIVVAAVAIVLGAILACYLIFGKKTVPVERIVVDSAEYTLFVGSTCTIEASVVPADATDTGLVWTSSNPDIASVSDGKINTLKEGKAVITVKSNDGNAQSTVTVIVRPMPKITVPFGTYSGPANGLGGEIRVTRIYYLDLRNAAHETLELRPGDIITRTKFKNGELVGGFWQRGSECRSFHR